MKYQNQMVGFFLANPKLNRNWQLEMAKHVPEIKSE